MLGKSRCDILGERMAERVGDLGERVGELGERVGDGFFFNRFSTLSSEVRLKSPAPLASAKVSAEWSMTRKE